MSKEIEKVSSMDNLFHSLDKKPKETFEKQQKAASGFDDLLKQEIKKLEDEER